MSSIRYRAQLAQLIPPGGTAIELGVAAGLFSDQLLSGGPGFTLVSVDRWSDHHDDAEYRMALRLLSRHGERSRVFRRTFDEALELFVDGRFDFVYIDGYAHTGQEGGKTLRDWWPKLKPGGIFAGHDYSHQYPDTVKAVDEFMESIGRGEPGNMFEQTLGDELPSWWFVK